MLSCKHSCKQEKVFLLLALGDETFLKLQTMISVMKCFEKVEIFLSLNTNNFQNSFWLKEAGRSSVIQPSCSHNFSFFGMAAMPFLTRGVLFSPKLSQYRITSLPCICLFSIFLFIKKQICICINGLGCHCLLFSGDLYHNKVKCC